jgi:hypothetical protein
LTFAFFGVSLAFEGFGALPGVAFESFFAIADVKEICEGL